jgi:hypothetical protein
MHARVDASGQRARRVAVDGAAQLTQDIDRQNGISTTAVSELMKETRNAVIAARSALF